ncbi:hypothetical protein [Mesorhizobium sp. 1B3]|uniref:hypothetical protein n=1 Tax=Mesorhizobium sp. 1B3 TaxID=3243599 RepID=UPI003D958B75
MVSDAGHDMKARLRADLSAAMKERRTDEARLIRALVAAAETGPEAEASRSDRYMLVRRCELEAR